MSYSNPLQHTYTFPAVDFGAGNSEKSFQGPKGKKGRVREIGFAVTEAFNAVTTSAKTRLGTDADNDLYAEVDMGTTAVKGGINMTGQANADKGQLITADSIVEVNFVAPTGGTPTGIADVFVTVDWF